MLLTNHPLKLHEAVIREIPQQNVVCLGAGLYPDGTLSDSSTTNAAATSMLINLGLVDGMTITTGRSPENEVDYPTTEADEMARVIIDATKDGEHRPQEIVVEPFATDTIGSLWNLAPFFESEGIDVI